MSFCDSCYTYHIWIELQTQSTFIVSSYLFISALFLFIFIFFAHFQFTLFVIENALKCKSYNVINSQMECTTQKFVVTILDVFRHLLVNCVVIVFLSLLQVSQIIIIIIVSCAIWMWKALQPKQSKHICKNWNYWRECWITRCTDLFLHRTQMQ